MSFVGLCSYELTAACVVEVQHTLRITLPAFDAGDLLHIVSCPQAIAITEGGEPALGTHPCPREDDQMWTLGALSIHRRETSESS